MGTSFLLFLVASFAGHVWAQKESGEGGMTAYANMESPRNTSLRSVRMLFFNPNDVNEAPVAVKSTAEITNFDNSLDTVVIIHGFADYYPGSYLIPALVKAYATYDKKNVIALDWGDLASAPWYLTAARNTFRVGEWLAAFLTAMMEVQNLSMDRLELVGFSLGAHIAGVASSLLSSQPRRIIGLDPAELLFAESPVEFILDKSDAPLVEIIHTSGGFIGFKRPIGHRDFYPNGGEHPQPGCEGDFAGTCSHRRAYQYFAEALLRRGRGFKATKCTSFEDFKAGKCQEGPRLSIANNNYDPNLRGTYFLMTNPTKPFGMKQA